MFVLVKKKAFVGCITQYIPLLYHTLSCCAQEQLLTLPLTRICRLHDLFLIDCTITNSDFKSFYGVLIA